MSVPRFRAGLACCIALVFALLPLAGFAPSALAQGATTEPLAPLVIDPEWCQPPGDAQQTASTSSESDAPAPVDPDLWDDTEGEPADAGLYRALSERGLGFLGCSNAADASSATGYVSVEFLQRYPELADASVAGGAPAPDEMLTFSLIQDARQHGPDTATMFLTVHDPTYCEEDITLAMVFRLVDGDWRIDDLAHLINRTPVRYDPPVVRRDDAPTCLDLEATPVSASEPGKGFRPPSALQQTGDGERTAQSVVAELQTSGGEVYLADVRVTGVLDLRGVSSGKLVAKRVQFADGIDISMPEDLSQLAPTGMDLFFSDTTFGGPVNFQLSQFDTLECHRCTFQQALDMSSANAGSVYLLRSWFQDAARFDYLSVSGVIDISNTHFEGHSDFSGARLGELRETRVISAEPLRITWDAFGPTWLDARIVQALGDTGEGRRQLLEKIDQDLLFWQRNFVALEQSEDADQVQAERLRLRNDHYLEWSDPEKWELTSIGFLTGWGADPLRPLYLIGFIVLTFGLIYWWRDPFDQSDSSKQAFERGNRFLFAILYSIDTFVPFAIVSGVREWGWVIRGPRRWAVVSERFIGALISAIYAINIGAYLL